MLLSPVCAVPSPSVIAIDGERRIQAEPAGHDHNPTSTIIGHGRALALHRPRTLEVRPATGIEHPRIFLVE